MHILILGGTKSSQISVWRHIKQFKSQLLFQMKTLTSLYPPNRYPVVGHKRHKVKTQAPVQRQRPQPWKDHDCWFTALLPPTSKVRGHLPWLQGHHQSLWSGLRRYDINNPTTGWQRGFRLSQHVGDVGCDHSYSERGQVRPRRNSSWCSGGSEGLWSFLQWRRRSGLF